MQSNNPSLPTISRLITNVFWFALLAYFLVNFLIGFNIQWLAYGAPLFLLGRILRPLVYKHTYGRKQEPIFAKDKRYKLGIKPKGYRWVKDKDRRYEFTSDQIKLSKLEGLIKLLIAVLVLINVHQTFNSATHIQKYLSEEEVLKLLEPGDTVIAKNNKVDVLVKVHKNEYPSTENEINESSVENASFELAFIDSIKILGKFIAIDSSKNNSSANSRYIAFSALIENNWSLKCNFEAENKWNINRVDSLYYVNLSEITVSISKLSQLKRLK